MKRPLVRLAWFWTTGLCVPLVPHLLAAAAAAALAGTVWAGAVERRAGPRRLAGTLLACWLVLGAGVLYGMWSEHRNRSELDALAAGQASMADDGLSVRVAGMLLSPADVDGDRASFRLSVREAQVSGQAADPHPLRETVQVNVKLEAQAEQSEAARWLPGDRLVIDGQLERPSPPGNFGAFDYPAWLRGQRIHWLLAADGAASVRAEPRPWSIRTPARWAAQARERLGGLVDRLYAPLHAGLLKSLLFGMREDLDPRVQQNFSRLGLMHVLAVSGLHVGVVVGALLGLLRLFGATRERAFAAGIAFLPVFMLVTGGAPSVVRAGMMGMIGLAVARKGKWKDSLSVVALVCVVLLVWNPYALLNIGFQLSFVVTAGLIAGVPKLTRLLPGPRRPAAALAVGLTAQAVSFPLTVLYFHQFSLLSLLANLLLVPVYSLFILPAGYVSVMLGSAYFPVGRFAARIVEWVDARCLSAIAATGDWSGFTTFWPGPSALWIEAYYGLLALLLVSLEKLRPAEERGRVESNNAHGSDDTAPLPLARPVAADMGRLEIAAARSDGAAADPGPRNEPEAGPGHAVHRRRAMLVAGMASLALALQLIYQYTPDRWDRRGLFDAIDVGQGDCLLIRTPEGRHILVDGGGTLRFAKPGDRWRERRNPYEVGRSTLVPLLKARGIHRLDLVIATHDDQDHIGGLRAVLEDIPVTRLITNGAWKKSPAVRQLFAEALKRHVPVSSAWGGIRTEVDGRTELIFLGPNRPASGATLPTVSVQNKLSLVFLLRMDGRSFLLTGDMEAGEEQEVLRNLAAISDGIRPASAADSSAAAAAVPRVDVLKVAHHGSKTSTTPEWLAYWQPRAAVISVGEHNLYGHPSPIVTDRLAAAEIPVYRTDLDGEVQICVDRGSLQIRRKRGDDR